MSYLTVDTLNKAILDNYRNIVGMNSYFINALSRFKGEELAKEPLISSLRISDYTKDKVVMNELGVSLTSQQYNLTNPNNRNRIDIAIANNDRVTDIIEIKIAYLGEFYTDNSDKSTLIERKPNKQIPSGIHTSITPNSPGIVDDIIKRQNEHCNVLGIYILKEVIALRDINTIEFGIVNKGEILHHSANSNHLESIKRIIETSISYKTNNAFISKYKVAHPVSIDLGTYKQDFSLKLHFFTLYADS